MENWLPSLKALRAFETAARHGSFSDAARELAVTPAAVQQLVHVLENALSVQLVVRRGRGIKVTGVGETAAPEITAGFERIKAAVDYMRRQSRLEHITLTVEPSFAILWLIPRLNKFQERHPRIKLLIETTTEKRDMRIHSIDVAIRYERSRQLNEGEYQLFEDETIAICSNQLLAGEVFASLDMLREAAIIHFEGPVSQRVQLDWPRWLARVGYPDLKPQREIYFTDYTASLNSAIAGQGFALASRVLVDLLLDSGVLVSPFAQRYRCEYSYLLLTNDESVAKEEVASFVDWLLDEAHVEGDSS